MSECLPPAASMCRNATFRKIKNDRKTDRVIVEVDKVRKAEFLEAIKRSGARVVK